MKETLTDSGSTYETISRQSDKINIFDKNSKVQQPIDAMESNYMRNLLHCYESCIEDNNNQINKNVENISEKQKIINCISWNSTSWNSITTALVINKSNLLANINGFCNENMNKINLLSITVKEHTEYVWIVKIFEGVSIGISLKCIPENNNIKIMNIYLDKKQIQNQLIIYDKSFR